MKTLLACTAFAVALLGLGSIASADDAMMAKPMMSHMPTMVCRPPDAGEKPNAMAGTKPMLCKAVDMKAMMAMKKSVEAMPNGEPMWLKMESELQVGPGTNE